MDNLNVLVEAKKEYMGQLCLIMCPAMIEVFQDMYNEAVTMSKGRKVLVMFQKLLKEVPNWSNAMSKQHSDNIANRCAWFNDLLAAVFVACTKILSAVRLKADNKKIALKLPTNEVFIQTCYNNVAKDLYKDPYIFHEDQSEHARDEILTSRFCACIEVTIKELIPVQQILQTYMSQESRDINLGGEIEDSPDPDVLEDFDEEPVGEPEAFGDPPPMESGDLPEPEGEAQVEPEMEPESEVQPPMEPKMTGLENEFKTIPTVKDPQAEEEDDGVLFGDAPEQRTKNPRYN
jgi:hypothetical protein